MPDQACANDVQLHDIPQDLQNILPLERRVISPWYGGHYKVNGPPVNVPATLDQKYRYIASHAYGVANTSCETKMYTWVQMSLHIWHDLQRLCH